MFNTVLVNSSRGLVLFLQVAFFPFHQLIGVLLFPAFCQLLNMLVPSSLGKLRVISISTKTFREMNTGIYTYHIATPFPSSLYLCFKTSPSAKPFIWKWVLLTGSFKCKSNLFFYMKGFALEFAPETDERQKATRKWPKRCVQIK